MKIIEHKYNTTESIRVVYNNVEYIRDNYFNYIKWYNISNDNHWFREKQFDNLEKNYQKMIRVKKLERICMM